VSRYQPCVYCNEPAEVRDHFDPVANRAGGRYMRDTVPSCSCCNTRKGRCTFETVGEAQDYIAYKLRLKYRKLLAAPHWEKDELRELGRGLRTDVTKLQDKKHYVLRRLNYLENEQKYWMHLGPGGRLTL
jgi:hypothetical protein